MQKTSVGLLRSLLYQIFREHPEVTQFPTRSEPLLHWTEKRLAKILQDIASDLSSSYRMCLFIDGLDEIDGDYEALIRIVEKLTQNVNIKVVLSSRPYSIFESAFGSATMLRLHDLTRADIEKFVTDKLFACPRIQSMAAQSSDFYRTAISKIIDYIVKKSDGVFLWVELTVKDQIRGINEEDSLEQLQERLRILPTKLEDLYTHKLNKIQHVHRKEAAWYLRLALLDGPRSLLDFTLAAYGRLDHDLISSVEFPLSIVVNTCQQYRKRINTTCVGFLEIHQMSVRQASSVRERSISEDSDAEDSIATNCSIREDRVRVTFLHRTAADFWKESEQGKKFLCMNTPPDLNVFVMWAKVLVVKVRIFSSSRYTFESVINEAAKAVSDAEYETGVAQTAINGYLEHAIETSCTTYTDKFLSNEINTWYHKSIVFRSKGNQARREDLSRPVSKFPVDYLGFAASHGMKFYVERQLQSLPANLRSHTADYLLCCMTNSLNPGGYETKKHLRLIDLICSILRYGGNPNMPIFQSTIWGQFLAFMLRSKDFERRRARDAAWNTSEHVWRTAFDCFLRHGADTFGMLSYEGLQREFDVRGHQFCLLSNAPLRRSLQAKPKALCQYVLRLELSVPTLLRYCLGSSAAAAEVLSDGALPYSRCTELNVSFAEGDTPWSRWTLSAQESNGLLKAYQRYILPTEEPPPSVYYGLECQVLLLYDELSAREPDGVFDSIVPAGADFSVTLRHPIFRFV